MKKIILPVIVLLLVLSLMYCEAASGAIAGKDPEVIACEQAVEEAYKQAVKEAGDDEVALAAAEVARQEGIDECNK